MHDEVSVLNILNGNLLIIRKSKIKLVDSSSSKCIQVLIVNVYSTLIEMRLHHLHTSFSCKENVALKMREKFFSTKYRKILCNSTTNIQLLVVRKIQENPTYFNHQHTAFNCKKNPKS